MANPVDRLREQHDISASDRRYIREEAPSLEDISDPSTMDDERKQSWREWVGENTLLTIVGMVFGLFMLAVMVYFLQRYSPAALSTLWTRRGLVLGGVGVGVGFYVGAKNLRAKMLSWDQLTIKTSENSAKRYYGYYLESDLGEYPLFVPIAGFSWNGLRSDVYRIADISREIVMKRGTPWEEDEPAIIRLDPDWTAVTHTDTGTVVVTVCDGFEPDPQGKEANLRPITPERGSKQRMVDMRNSLEKAREDRDFYEELAKKRKGRLENLLENMEKPIDEIVDEHVEFFERIQNSIGQRSRSRGNSSDGDEESSGVGPTANLSDIQGGSDE